MGPPEERKEEECYLCLGRFLLLSVVLEIKTVRMGGCPARCLYFHFPAGEIVGTAIDLEFTPPGYL